MKIQITILILAIEILTIFSLNKIIIRPKGMILTLIIGFSIFVLGLCLKRFDMKIDYRLFLVPFIQIGLLSICQVIFKLSFKVPFYIYMRGFDYPQKLRTNESGFVEFLSGVISIGIIIVILFIFFAL